MTRIALLLTALLGLTACSVGEAATDGFINTSEAIGSEVGEVVD